MISFSEKALLIIFAISFGCATSIIILQPHEITNCKSGNIVEMQHDVLKDEYMFVVSVGSEIDAYPVEKNIYYSHQASDNVQVCEEIGKIATVLYRFVVKDEEQ